MTKITELAEARRQAERVLALEQCFLAISKQYSQSLYSPGTYENLSEDELIAVETALMDVQENMNNLREKIAALHHFSSGELQQIH